ncbi:unnamed protein product [Plutella xylostella]|uniref:(diamondback moth) hypothetical protein n=1 Tax=Plutella xylostella TaxID=51655 RepID=A0A8S4G147_PLUXY|nr:unnamed protein product [Plutella xylostella]
MDTTPEEAAQVVALLQQGLSQRAVAAQLHLSQSAVSRVYRRFQETGAFNRRPRTGRHRCTSERDDRFIVSTSLRNRHLTGVDVQQELRRVRQVTVSEWTVRRRLKEANLTPKRPASGPKLTAGHRQARLQFAREHLDWSIAQWRSVLFTDECRVCLHGSDRRGRVYRRPGERFAQCCFAETVAYGGGSCMMWAGISLEGKTALVFVPGGGRGGGLTADRYITDILLGHVVPYAEFVGEDFVLMHDNARCHTARVSRQFLREKELRTMDWPALSPDLNPIEHLWDELKRRVRARNPVPASVDELKTALLEEWDGIPQETVKKLIRSMRNRLQAVDGILNRLHVSMPTPRDSRARPPTAPPPGVKRRERVERHIELEQGDDYVLECVVYYIRPPTAPPPGVKRRERVDRHIELEQGDDYVLDLQKNYTEIAEEERHDPIPEFWEGHNIADYIDPEIFEKLAELEKDEELREEAGMYAVPKIELDETMKEIRELARQIRNKKAVLKDESRLTKQSTKPVMPRNTRARGRERSTTRLRDEMEKLGVDMSETKDAHFTRRRARSRSASGVANKRAKMDDGRARSVSRPARDEQGVKDTTMARRAKNMAHVAIAKKTKKMGLKGEADRFIGTKMPKHLFAGKRGVGKTDRR